MPKSTPRLLQFPSVNPTDETELICVNFKIPNRPEYKAIIKGQLHELTLWGVWEKDGTRNGTEIAQMFRKLFYDHLTFDLDCDGMSCEDIFDCLEETDDGQRLINLTRPSQGNTTLQQTTINNFNLYKEFNIDKSAETICEDYLFAAIRQLIVYLDGLIKDFLESVEAGFVNNVVEFTDVIGRVTFVDESSADAIIAFIQWVIDNIVDAYGVVADTALLDQIACDIFCATKDDCTVTIDDFYSYFNEKSSSLIPDINSITSIITFIQDMANIATGFADERVVYVMFAAMFGIVKLADGILGETIKAGNAALEIYTYLKAFSNDEDADWAILCEDCLPCAEITDFTFYNPSTGAIIDSSLLIQYLGNNKYRMTTYKDDLGNNTFFVFRPNNAPFSLNFRESISGSGFLFLGADNVYVTGNFPNPSPTQEENPTIEGFYWAWGNTQNEPPYVVEFFSCPI